MEELSLELPAQYSIERHIEQKEIKAFCIAVSKTCRNQIKVFFLYRYFYGFKIRDIATILNLSTKKVENILYHGKNKLRKDLLERGIHYV